MLRFLLAPRQLALHVLAAALVAGMAWLGLWQMGRASGSGPSEAPTPVPLEQLARPGSPALPGAYDRHARATGRYDTARQLLVPGRSLEGRTGSWLLVPLRLPDGTAVPVVRGWVPPGDVALYPPLGEVTVTGRFLPSEEALRRPPPLGENDVATVDTTTLSARWPYPLPEGYLLAAEETPAPGTTPVRVPEDNAAPRDTGSPFTNVGYALQWWAFAGLVVWFWWRLLRDRWRERHPRPSSESAAPVTVPAGR